MSCDFFAPSSAATLASCPRALAIFSSSCSSRSCTNARASSLSAVIFLSCSSRARTMSLASSRCFSAATTFASISAMRLFARRFKSSIAALSSPRATFFIVSLAASSSASRSCTMCRASSRSRRSRSSFSSCSSTVARASSRSRRSASSFFFVFSFVAALATDSRARESFSSSCLSLSCTNARASSLSAIVFASDAWRSSATFRA